jgi:hypothetical protein
MMITARVLAKEMKYQNWRNFYHVVLGADHLILNGVESGKIHKIRTRVLIGRVALEQLTIFPLMRTLRIW